MRRTAGYTWTDCKTNAQIPKELKITPILDKLLDYKRSWIKHVNRMPQNRLCRIMKYYSPTGRRNHGRPLKRLLDTWDQNRSTSGPSPWKIYYNDEETHSPKQSKHNPDLLIFYIGWYPSIYGGTTDPSGPWPPFLLFTKNDIHQSTVLQPRPGPGLPEKTPPFFPVFCSSPPSSYSMDLQCVPPDNFLPPCSPFHRMTCHRIACSYHYIGPFLVCHIVL